MVGLHAEIKAHEKAQARSGQYIKVVGASSYLAGQPGDASGPNTTAMEVGLYAEIKAHEKAGKKRRKQVYLDAQENPEQARSTKRQRPTYEIEKPTCRSVCERLGLVCRACHYLSGRLALPKGSVPYK